jgi:hypothetical protein
LSANYGLKQSYGRAQATVAAQFLEGYYGAGAFGVQTYLDAMGGSEEASQFYMMQYDPVYDNPAKPGFLKDGFLTPTAILTSAQGFTAARRVVEKGADKVRAAILTQRIDAAKLPIYLVALFRWQELEAFAVQTGQPWPLPETTLVGAYAEWSRVFTANRMSLGLGPANGCCDNTTSFYKLVFNLSKSTMAQGPPQLKSDDAADKNTAGPTATTSIAWSEPVIMHGAWETRWTGGPNGAAHAIRIDGNESTGPPRRDWGPQALFLGPQKDPRL